VLAVVIEGDNSLLVRRRNPPEQLAWGFPGGKVEYGETVFDAALRELKEETGLDAAAERYITVIDAIQTSPLVGENPYHHVLVAVGCKRIGGEIRPGDDALDVRWVTLKQLEQEGFQKCIGVAELVPLAICSNRDGDQDLAM